MSWHPSRLYLVVRLYCYICMARADCCNNTLALPGLRYGVLLSNGCEMWRTFMLATGGSWQWCRSLFAPVSCLQFYYIPRSIMLGSWSHMPRDNINLRHDLPSAETSVWPSNSVTVCSHELRVRVVGYIPQVVLGMSYTYIGRLFA